MREVCLACIGFIIESMVFLAAGSLLTKALKMKADISMQFVLGYLAYFAVFELFIVPLTLLWVTLTTAAFIWAAVMAGVLCVAVVLTVKKWKNAGTKYRAKARQREDRQLVFLIAVGFVVVVQCLIVIFYQDTTIDAAYYVGTVTTSVYTDTLARYNSYTGRILKTFQARYIFSGYPMNNAVWCRLLGIHPLVQCKTVMSCINVAVANIILYQIGKRLFSGERKKACLMVIFVCILQLFCGTLYSAGTFFFTRSYEGKSILANIAIPAVLMCAVWFLQEKNDRNIWIVLFLTSVSALTFSGSSIIFPVVITAGMAPVAVMNKKISGLLGCVVCMLPSVVYAVVFFACRLGWLTLAAS